MAITTTNLETVINAKVVAATDTTDSKELLLLSKSIEALNTSPVNLSNLGDADLTALLDGHVLRYVAATGMWTSGAPTGHPEETLTSLALNGSALTYTDESGTLNSIDLSTTLNTDSISDIVVSNPVNGEVLTYNEGNAQWENTALSGAPSTETFTRTIAGGESSEITLTTNHNNSSSTTVKEIAGAGGSGTAVTTQWDFEENAAWDYDNTKAHLYGSRVSLLGTPHEIAHIYPSGTVNHTVWTTTAGKLWGAGFASRMYGNIGPWAGYSSGSSATFATGKEMDHGLPSGYIVKQFYHAYRYMHVLLDDGKMYSCGDRYKGRLGFSNTASTSTSYRYSIKVWNNNSINTLVPKNENEYETVEWFFVSNAYGEVVVLMSDGSVWYTGEGNLVTPQSSTSSYTSSWTKNQAWTDEVQSRMTPDNNYELPKIWQNDQDYPSDGDTYVWMYWEDGTSLALGGPGRAASFNRSNITSISQSNNGYAYYYSFPQLTGFTGTIKLTRIMKPYSSNYVGFYVLTTTGQLWGLGYVWLGENIPGYINSGGTNYNTYQNAWTLLRDDVNYFHGVSYSTYGGQLLTLNDGTLWSHRAYNSSGRLGIQSLNGLKDTSSATNRTAQSYKNIVNEPWTTAVRAWPSGGYDQIIVEDADGAFWLQGYYHSSYLSLASNNGDNAHSWKASVFDTTAGTLITSTTAMDLTVFSSIVKITAEGSFPTGTTTKYAISLDDKVSWVIPNGSSTTTVTDASTGCDLATLETFDFASNPSTTLYVQLWIETSNNTFSPQIDRVSLWTTQGGRLLQSYVGFEVEEVGSNIIKITNTGASEKTYQLRVEHS